MARGRSETIDRGHAAAAEPDRSESADTVLELKGVTKSYDGEPAVSELTLSVREGELLTLLGPSGCGKTTTLQLLAGLEEPTAGTVEIAGQRVAGAGTFVPPEGRDVGLVFQDYALFPHLTVSENVAFGLEGDDPERVAELLELVDLAGFEDRAIDGLSGGQRQRVALARALAPEPDVLLLDEPFSNLDVRLRVEMRQEVRRILKAAGVTAVSVTHDQEEALSISDRVVVMDDGGIEQVGRPETVFEHPRTRFVAEFLGQAGFVSGRLAGGVVETSLGTFHPTRLVGFESADPGADIDVLVRPDDLRAVPTTGTDAESVRAFGRVVNRQYIGPSFVYEVELDAGDTVYCQHNHSTEIDLDQRVGVSLVADHALAWYPARE